VHALFDYQREEVRFLTPPITPSPPSPPKKEKHRPTKAGKKQQQTEPSQNCSKNKVFRAVFET